MSVRIVVRAAFAAVVGVVVAACTEADPRVSNTPPPGAALKRSDVELHAVASCDELKDYIAESLVAQYTSGNYYGYGLVEEEATLLGGDALGSDAFEGGGSSSGGAGGGERSIPDDVSQTNVQEEGIDEPDLVKAASDGTLYIVSGGTLHVVSAFPATQAALAGTVAVGGSPFELFLDEAAGRAVAFGSAYAYRGYLDDVAVAEADAGAAEPNFGSGGDAPFAAAQLTFLNVANPAAPFSTGTLFLQGWYLTARMQDERIHVVTGYHPDMPAALANDNEFWELVGAYGEAWWQRYGNSDDVGMDGEAVGGGGSAVAKPIPANATTTSKRAPQRGQSLLPQSAFASLSLEDLRARMTSKIYAAVATADASEFLPRSVWRDADGSERDLGLLTCTNVYRPTVAQTGGYVVVTSLDTDGGNAAATAAMAPGGIVYAGPQHLYVAQTSAGWWWSWDQPTQTAVHQFAFAGTVPVYRASGLVDGWVYGQFALSERDGFLRVATTHDEPAGESIARSNNLYVLERDGGALNVVAAVTGFGPDESIFSVRYVDDKAYVVTFRQTDPLFVFDLANPRAPALLGEVQIPGFSTYMHPLDAGHLLTIGVAGTDAGVSGGIELQIFDVSDPAAPTRIHAHTIAGSENWGGWSPAQYDHRAFTYDAERGILAIPLVTYASGQAFAGVAAFSVHVTDGITELGRVDHAQLAYDTYCTGEYADDYACTQGEVAWSAAPQRAVLMSADDDTYVYAISHLGLTVSHLDNIAVPLRQVAFVVEPYGWWWY